MNCHFRLLFPFLLLVAGCLGNRSDSVSESEEKNVAIALKQAKIDVAEALETYLTLRAKTDNVDTDVDGAVFWCGENKEIIAQDWARENGKKTLEQTVGGKYLDSLKLFREETTVLAKEQAAIIWDIASRRYSEKAKGTVYFFSCGEPRLSARSGFDHLSTLFRLELPILLANPKVKEIRVMEKERGGEEEIIQIRNGKGIRKGVVGTPKYTIGEPMNLKGERANYGIVKGRKWPAAKDKYQYFGHRMYAYGAREYETELMKQQGIKRKRTIKYKTRRAPICEKCTDSEGYVPSK